MLLSTDLVNHYLVGVCYLNVQVCQLGVSTALEGGGVEVEPGQASKHPSIPNAIAGYICLSYIDPAIG